MKKSIENNIFINNNLDRKYVFILIMVTFVMSLFTFEPHICGPGRWEVRGAVGIN